MFLREGVYPEYTLNHIRVPIIENVRDVLN